MSNASIVAILAALGIIVTGAITPDARAFAAAVRSTDSAALVRFARSYPESQFAPDALLVAAQDAKGREYDKAVSSVNGNLTCELWIERVEGGEAKVRWSISGASEAGLMPLNSKGTLPASGERTVKLEGLARVFLKVRDSSGNEASCWVTTNGSAKSDDVPPPPPSLVASV
jgi:hypothetical protein